MATICASCGASGEGTFCSSCGQPLAAPAPTSSPPPPPPEPEREPDPTLQMPPAPTSPPPPPPPPSAPEQGWAPPPAAPPAPSSTPAAAPRPPPFAPAAPAAPLLGAPEGEPVRGLADQRLTTCATPERRSPSSQPSAWSGTRATRATTSGGSSSACCCRCSRSRCPTLAKAARGPADGRHAPPAGGWAAHRSPPAWSPLIDELINGQRPDRGSVGHRIRIALAGLCWPCSPGRPTRTPRTPTTDGGRASRRTRSTPPSGSRS